MPKITYMISVLAPSNQLGYFFTQDRFTFIKMQSYVIDVMPDASVQCSFKPSVKGETLHRISCMADLERFIIIAKEKA